MRKINRLNFLDFVAGYRYPIAIMAAVMVCDIATITIRGWSFWWFAALPIKWLLVNQAIVKFGGTNIMTPRYWVNGRYWDYYQYLDKTKMSV